MFRLDTQILSVFSGLRKNMFLLIAVGLSCSTTYGSGFCKGNRTLDWNGSDTAGFAKREFADSSRSNWLGTGPRPLRTLIWYPLDSYKGKRPLILISHGSRGSAVQMEWLGVYLAERGYIAVAVNHDGTPAEERLENGFPLTELCMWERPGDLSSVLDKILRDTVFGGQIDTSRIAVAGFSLGGATAIWISGARFDYEHLRRNSPPPPPQLAEGINRQLELTKSDPVVRQSRQHMGDSFRDRRIKAVFALAPAIGQAFTAEGLKGIDVPVQIVVGDADLVAPRAENADLYQQNIKSAKRLIVLPGERGHYLKTLSVDQQAAELREVSEIAYRFFQETLR